MSNLLNDAEGRNIVVTAQRYLLERRLSRFFKRNLVIDYDQWSNGGDFDLATLLGQLNPAWDDELRDLYRLLGSIGGLSESLADATYYVDSVNGSDVTGTGSAATPYASLWFLPNLPKKINHIFRILILEDLTITDLLIDSEIGDGGSLSIVGVGAETSVVDTGDTINTGTGDLSAYLSVPSVDPVVASNEKYFLQNKSDSFTSPCWFADTIAVTNAYVSRYLATTLSPADEFRFVIPPVTISLTNLAISSKGPTIPPGGTPPTGISNASTRVNFVNVNLAFGTNPKLSIDSAVDCGFWFVRMLVPATMSEGNFRISNTRINYHNPFDTDLATVSQTGVANLTHNLPLGNVLWSCGCFLVNSGVGSLEFDDYTISLDSSSILCCFDTLGAVYFRGNSQIFNCAIGSFHYRDTVSYIYDCPANAQGVVGSRTMHDCVNSRLRLHNCWMGYGDDAITLYSSRMQIGDTGGSTVGNSAFNNSVLLNGLSKMYLVNAWQGVTGGVSDLEFADTAVPTTAAFPAANAMASDVLDQNVVRGS